jgi:FtsP/CotA-like multicopper oxidase with cupredoxin domain
MSLTMMTALVTAARSSEAPPITYDSAARTVSLSLTAGMSGGYTFNGYMGGALVVKVPAGAVVKVTMRNAAPDVSHSVLVAPWSDRVKGSGFTPAFPGAAPAGVEAGITAHDPPLRFTFTASAPGTYALVCGVPGHALIGMWDEFDVVDGLKTPSVTAK